MSVMTADVMKLPERSDFEALKEPRHYGMARAALRLPNPGNKAEWNSTHVRFESAQKVWEDFVSAGLARQRKALPFEGAKGAVYELTYLGISAVLEEGESRGAAKVSAEEDLVPLVAPDAVVSVNGESGEAKPVTEKPGPETATEEPVAEVFSSQPFDGIDGLMQAMKKARERDEPCAPDSQDEWLLEQAVFRAANNDELPVWVREVVKALWAEVCKREKWHAPVDAEAAASEPELVKAA
jgi:hypothetical protein